MSAFMNHEEEIRNYFGSVIPVGVIEWMRFWYSLTAREKDYYRHAPITMASRRYRRF